MAFLTSTYTPKELLFCTYRLVIFLIVLVQWKFNGNFVSYKFWDFFLFLIIANFATRQNFSF